MTIKQLGGVFGRNPTFNNVTIDGDLTVDGTVIHTGDLTIDNINISGNTISSTNTNGNIILDPNGTGYSLITAPTNGTIAQYGDTNSRTFFVKQANVGGYDNDTLIHESDSGVGQFQWKNSTRTLATLTNAGNLAFPSGQGIDFSATAGTGTSELLDDYEEGAWTPGLAGYGPTPTTAQGTYIKVGGMVMAGFKIVLNGSDASQFRINSLPFVAGSAGGPDYGDGGYITFTDSGVTDIRLISDGSDDVLAYDSSGASISYTSVGATAEIKGTIIYSTV